MDAIYTEQHGRYLLSIHHDDEAPLSPREDDNLTTITTWAPRWDHLGDDNAPNLSTAVEDYGIQETVGESIRSEAVALWPLIVLDYGSSGLNLRLGEDTPEAWNAADGAVYITPERVKVVGTPPEHFEAAARGELAVYEAYCNGDVYGYMIEREDTCNLGHVHRETVESCWGYYRDDDKPSDAGYGLGYVLGEARAAVPEDAPAPVPSGPASS